MEDERIEDEGDISPEEDSFQADDPDQGTSEEREGTSVDEVPKKMGFGEKVLNIFVEPSSVFKNICYHNDWLTPLVIGTVVTVVLGIFTMPHTQYLQESMRGLLPAGASGGGMDGGVLTWVAVVLSPLGMMLNWLIAAAVLFVLGSFLLENVDFKKVFSIVAFAWLPTLFTQIVAAIHHYGQTPDIISVDDYLDAALPWTISLARVMPAEGILGGVLLSFDVFTFWGLWLTFLGLVYALRNPAGKVWSVLIIYFILFVLFTVGSFALTFVQLNHLRQAGL